MSGIASIDSGSRCVPGMVDAAGCEVRVGAAVRLAASECPTGDALAQRDIVLHEAFGPLAGEHASTEAMPFPVRLEEREPVDREHLGQSIGSRMQDALRVVLSLQRPRGFDEEPGEAPIVEAHATGRGHGDHLDRGLERVAAFVEDTDLPALKPGDGHDVVGGLGERGINDERPREMRANPVLDADLGDHRSHLLAVDTSGDDASAEAGDEHNSGSEVRLGDLVLHEPGGQHGVQENEVGAQLGDEVRVERRGDDAVDRKQEPERAKLAKTLERHLFERSFRLGSDDPGELARVEAKPACCGGDGELGRAEDLVRERHEEHGGSGVLGKRERRDHHLVRGGTGRAWQRLIPQVDTVDEVDHRLQGDARTLRRAGSVGRCTAHHCCFQAAPRFLLRSEHFP